MDSKKAIQRVEQDGVRLANENEVLYDCDYSLFRPIVEQMNEMGAPITHYI